MFISASFQNPHYFNTVFVHVKVCNIVRTPVFFHYILILVYLYLHANFKSSGWPENFCNQKVGMCNIKDIFKWLIDLDK